MSWAPFLSPCPHTHTHTHTQTHARTYVPPAQKRVAKEEFSPGGSATRPSPERAPAIPLTVGRRGEHSSREPAGSRRRVVGLLAPQPGGQGKAGLVLGPLSTISSGPRPWGHQTSAGSVRLGEGPCLFCFSCGRLRPLRNGPHFSLFLNLATAPKCCGRWWSKASRGTLRRVARRSAQQRGWRWSGGPKACWKIAPRTGRRC